MFMIFPFLVALTLAVMAHQLWMRVAKLPRIVSGWGAPPLTDPRVAVAAMMYAVAAEGGSVTREKMDQMRSLLVSMIDLTPEQADICLANGRTAARRCDGSLNSRLHQMRGPIGRNCSALEKEDVVQMLRAVAGESAERVPSIREALGRIAGSLLHG